MVWSLIDFTFNQRTICSVKVHVPYSTDPQIVTVKIYIFLFIHLSLVSNYFIQVSVEVGPGNTG